MMSKKIVIAVFIVVGFGFSTIAMALSEWPLENDPIEPKLETIDQYAFLVIDLGSFTVVPQYGETVELVFMGNKRTKLYNLSGKEIKYFHDMDGKLVAFVTPENLRYFQRETLKKVIFNRNGRREVFKVSLPVDFLLTNEK